MKIANTIKTGLLITIAGAGLALSAVSEAYVAASRIGDLHDGWSQNLTLHLERGVRYVIAGTCDSDCADLDLEVLNGRGVVVADDTGPDDTPLVAFRPAYSGDYTVRVIMAGCVVSPCTYKMIAVAG